MLAFRRVFFGGFGVGFGGCRRCGKNLFPGLGLGSSCSWGHLSAADAAVDTIIGWILNHVNRFATSVRASDSFELETSQILNLKRAEANSGAQQRVNTVNNFFFNQVKRATQLLQ